MDEREKARVLNILAEELKESSREDKQLNSSLDCYFYLDIF